MKLRSAHFSNFRILADVEINFDSASTNTIFLNGLNGRGKTSFQQGLYWCLYGTRPEGDLANSINLSKHEKGSRVEVAFTFELGEDDFENVTISRFAEVSKDELGSQKIGQTGLAILGQPKGDSAPSEPVAKPDVWLAERFPTGLQQFFLFDGESLEKFFEIHTKSAIRDAVREIAGVEAFEDLTEVLQGIVNSARSDKTSGSGTAESKELERQAKEKLIAKLEKIDADYEIELRQLKAEQREINDYFERVGGNEQHLLRDGQLSEEIEETERRIREARESLHLQLIDRGVPFALRGGMREVFVEARKAEQNNELPPPFNKSLMREILTLGQCVCGEPVAEGSKRHKHIEDEIERHAEADELGRKILNTLEYAKSLETNSVDFFSTLEAQSASIARADKELKEKRDEKKILTALLSGVNKSETEEKRRRRDSLQDLIPEKIKEQSLNQDQIAREKALADKLDKDVRKLTGASARNRKLDALISLASSLIEAAVSAKAAAVATVQSRLEESVNREFSALKEGTFRTRITDEFEVQTLGPDGKKVALSSGENMMKAYVFAIALREVVGFKFPLIVDTPFGRLDDENRERLVDMIARMVGLKGQKAGNQVVFLMHNAEYTPHIREAFKKTKPQELYLHWTVAEGQSQVGQGVDPEWLGRGSWAGVKK